MQLPGTFMKVQDFSIFEDSPAPEESVPRPQAPKTIAFFGKPMGVSLAALSSALRDNQRCYCLIQAPESYDATAIDNPNLRLIRGSMTDPVAVTRCLTKLGENRLVDAICFVVETNILPSTNTTRINTNVCKDGITCILKTLSILRSHNYEGRPIIAALGRSGLPYTEMCFPATRFPMYYHVLSKLRADIKDMEERIHYSGELFVVVRPNFLTNGPASDRPVVERMEDVVQTGPDREFMGCPISREAVGLWMYQKVLKAGATRIEGTAMAIGWTLE